MIENLQERCGQAFGFKVIGKLTPDDVVSLSEGIDQAVSRENKPISLLADLSQMEGADWSTRCEEMRFLQRHSEKIARMAVISDNECQEVYQMILVATVAIQAQTQYFNSSQIHRAWRWVEMVQTTTDPNTVRSQLI